MSLPFPSLWPPHHVDYFPHYVVSPSPPIAPDRPLTSAALYPFPGITSTASSSERGKLKGPQIVHQYNSTGEVLHKHDMAISVQPLSVMNVCLVD